MLHDECMLMIYFMLIVCVTLKFRWTCFGEWFFITITLTASMLSMTLPKSNLSGSNRWNEIYHNHSIAYMALLTNQLSLELDASEQDSFDTHDLL